MENPQSLCLSDRSPIQPGASAQSFLTSRWLSRPATQVAPDLIGCTLVRQLPNGDCLRGQIVETEAYEAGDPACHAYRRKTARNAVMFGPAGFTYVYLIYGMYHCLNVVTDRSEFASAVLIRALQLETIPPLTISRREPPHRLAAGPGKLCRVLQIDLSLTAQPLQPGSSLWLEPRSNIFRDRYPHGQPPLVQTTRIGLSQGVDLPWRWYLADSPAVSKR